MVVVMEHKNFLGIDCIEIRMGRLDLLVSASVGPRILSLRMNGGNNIFAELPGQILEYPGEGDFHFYGGHRLWCGPEDPAITYRPDSQPITIRESDGSVELVQAVDPITCIQKKIRITPTDFEDVLVIDHFIKNIDDKPFQCAPWAITQLRLGGVAILPLQIQPPCPDMVLPDRSIALWPYSDISDSRLTMDNAFITVDAMPIDKPLKIGIANAHQWIAYYLEDMLFIKYASDYSSHPLIDKGATSQCYCNSQFIELETLGPLTVLQREEESCHREVWRMVQAPIEEYSVDAIEKFILHDEMTDICRAML